MSYLNKNRVKRKIYLKVDEGLLNDSLRAKSLIIEAALHETAKTSLTVRKCVIAFAVSGTIRVIVNVNQLKHIKLSLCSCFNYSLKAIFMN